MSKPRFKIYSEIDTLAHALTIRDAIIAELVGKDIFEQHNLSAFDDTNGLSGKILVIAEWRFNNDAARDAVRDWAKDQIQNHPQIKNWVLSARLSWHRCTHDDPVVQDCKTTNYFEWSK